MLYIQKRVQNTSVNAPFCVNLYHNTFVLSFPTLGYPRAPLADKKAQVQSRVSERENPFRLVPAASLPLWPIMGC
jgi:hypothetical protein